MREETQFQLQIFNKEPCLSLIALKVTVVVICCATQRGKTCLFDLARGSHEVGSRLLTRPLLRFKRFTRRDLTLLAKLLKSTIFLHVLFSRFHLSTAAYDICLLALLNLGVLRLLVEIVTVVR